MDAKKQGGAVDDLSAPVDKRLIELLKITESFDCPDASTTVFETVMDALQEVVGYSSCSIHLLEPRGQYVYLAASRGIPDDLPDPVMQVVRIEDLSRPYMMPLAAHKPYRPEEYRTGKEVQGVTLSKDILHGEIIKIPLLCQDELIGSLTIVSEQISRERFDTEQQWLSILGRQLGTLIKQMNSYKQFQNLAILQERGRVSQELHDNLSQFVGTIRLLSERLSENLRIGNFEKAEEDALSLESISRDAYASVREDMLGLRYIEYPDQDILSTIQDYAERFQRLWGIDTTFETIGIERSAPIVPAKGIQLFRIIQEALTNVRRHAQASHVTITIEIDKDTLIGRVSDNGVGFDARIIPDIKLGLRIMRERACDIGGIVRVASSENAGTTVQVEIPMSIIN